MFRFQLAKNVEEMKFHIDALMLKYFQITSNSSFQSSLASAFDSINKIKACSAISKIIEESLTREVGCRNRIYSELTVLRNQK